MMEDILGKIEPYDGKDPNLHEEPYCISCLEGENATLLWCSRCKLVYYCNRDCQKKHFPEHKRACKWISKLESKYEKEKAKLEHCQDFGLHVGPPVNVFETQAGFFWGLVETRDYMRARLQLANTIHDEIAYHYEIKVVWEAVLEHYQESLRLCAGDNLGLRFRFPFLLLCLNRDDDAFDFVCHWEGGSNENEDLYTNSNAGEWIYPRREGSRFLDLFEECNDNLRYESLALLVAAATIKMRIIAGHEAKKETTNLFKSTPGGQELAQVESVISGMVHGDEAHKAKMENQKSQLNKLLDLIDKNNSTMLPALLNPGPLMSQGPPGYYQIGRPSEAYSVVADAKRIWARIPGALQLLEGRYGPNPSYSTDTLM